MTTPRSFHAEHTDLSPCAPQLEEVKGHCESAGGGRLPRMISKSYRGDNLNIPPACPAARRGMGSLRVRRRRTGQYHEANVANDLNDQIDRNVLS
jgi:hypothetical protein